MQQIGLNLFVDEFKTNVYGNFCYLSFCYNKNDSDVLACALDMANLWAQFSFSIKWFWKEGDWKLLGY